MTIDSGWVKILKNNCPNAFTPNLASPSQKPEVVFIDGQIKLMKAEFINTWELFFQVQFLNTVMNAFKTGASIVVLGFDNYAHVPASKAPTQRKRSSKLETMEFGPEDLLPSSIPASWNEAIRNRTFKNKVVKMICTNLQRHTFPGTVWIDWVDLPLQISGNKMLLPQNIANNTGRRGECDIKAFDWADLGNLLVISTDGDYIPMAMIQTEKSFNEDLQKRNIFIHRMKTNIEVAKTGTKREKPKREYEYVNISHLTAYVQHELNNNSNACTAFASLVAMTGCDFTLSLPRLGPIKIWKFRKGFHLLGEEMHPWILLILVLKLYIQEHTNGLPKAKNLLSKTNVIQDEILSKKLLDDDLALRIRSTYDDFNEQVSQSKKIAPSIKEKMWNFERCFAHCKNTTWTILYWTHLKMFPCPLKTIGSDESMYGYVSDKKGRINFEAVI